jgi:hypothetical protein
MGDVAHAMPPTASAGVEHGPQLVPTQTDVTYDRARGQTTRSPSVPQCHSGEIAVGVPYLTDVHLTAATALPSVALHPAATARARDAVGSLVEVAATAMDEGVRAPAAHVATVPSGTQVANVNPSTPCVRHDTAATTRIATKRSAARSIAAPSTVARRQGMVGALPYITTVENGSDKTSIRGVADARDVACSRTV